MRRHMGLAAGLVMVGMGLGAMAAQAQSVRVNWRERAPFADFRTYQVVAGKADPAATDPFWTQFVPKYLNSALQAKGLNVAAGGQTPDLKAVYRFQTEQVRDRETTVDGYGWGGGPWGGWGGFGGWGGWGGPETATTRDVPRTMGVLTVDLVDTRSNQVVWRGQATEDNVAESNHKEEDQVWKSVGKMFEHYPPKPDGK